MMRPVEVSRRLVTPPAQEPVTLAELKDHIRVLTNDEDALLSGYLRAARELIEYETWRALITQTWEIRFDRFGDMRLPLPPLQSVTSVTYSDEGGDTNALDPSVYRVVEDNGAGLIERVPGESWPRVGSGRNPVLVTFVAGYGATGADVPQIYRQAILLTAAHYYLNRESIVVGHVATEIPFGARALIDTASARRFV